MSNIVTLARTNVQQPTSPILFDVYERPLAYLGSKRGSFYPAEEWKALVRVAPNGNGPLCLNIVGRNYKTVQNAELFGAIDSGIFNALGARADYTCDIVDKAAYGGRKCYRQYIFGNDLSFKGPEQQDIRFRIVVMNAFGSGAIRVYAGAIDMFCTNGMILGEFYSEYAKHTTNLTLKRFSDVVERAVDAFWKNKDLMHKLRAYKVTDIDAVSEWLIERFGKTLGGKLLEQYLIEARTRGHNLWALFSAMIYYSSHADGRNGGVEFSLRNTGNDHHASTMHEREQRMSKFLIDQRSDLLQLAA